MHLSRCFSLARPLKGLPIGLALCFFALAACNTEDYHNLISEQQSVAQQRSEQARSPAPPLRYNPLTVTDSVWTGSKATRILHGLPLPERFEANRSMAIISSSAMSLHAIARAISSQTGLPVRFEKDTDDEEGGAGSFAAPSTPVSGRAGAVPAPKAVMASSSAAPREGMRLAYEGSLSGLLDRVASHFGVAWKYDGNAVSFARYETRVFSIDALAGTQKVTDGMKDATTASTSGSSSGSGGSSTSTAASSASAVEQNSSFAMDFKFWDEVGKTLEVLMGGVGTYSLAPSSGTIAVVTTPELMRTVAEYINQENQRLSRQVVIDVEVYTIDISEGEDFDTSFKSVLSGKGLPATSLTSAGSPARSTAVGSLASGSLVTNLLLNDKINLSSMFNLLSQVGKTARVASFPLTTVNNRPVSRRVGTDTTYVASVQNSISGTSSIQSSAVTPGVISDGFSIQLTPRIMGDGRVLLQYSLSLTDIVSITPFTAGSGGTTGTTTVQLPKTSSRIFVQQTILRSGSTLVLAGYNQDTVTQNSSGVGNPYNYLLGGGVDNGKTRQILFIAMTPQEITLPRTENE